MDNLKKYLQNHADELDSDVPGEAVWQRIEKSAAPVLPKSNVVKMAWRYAAAACVLACLTTVFFIVNKKETPATNMAVNTPATTAKQNEPTVVAQPQTITIPTPETTEETTHTTPNKTTPSKNNYVSTKPPQKVPQIIKRQITIDPAQLLVQDVEKNYAQLVSMQLNRLRATPVYAESPNYFSTFKQQLKQIEADEITIKKDIKLHGLTDELLQQLININQQKLTVLKDLQAEISKLNNKVKSPETRADSSQAFYLTM